MRKKLSILCLVFSSLLLPLQARPATAHWGFVLTLPHSNLYEIDLEISNEVGHWREVYHKPMTDEALPTTVHEGAVACAQVQKLGDRVQKVCWVSNHPARVEYVDTPGGCLFATDQGWLATDVARICRDSELRGLALDTFRLLRRAQLVALITQLKRSGPAYSSLIPLLESIARAKMD